LKGFNNSDSKKNYKYREPCAYFNSSHIRVNRNLSYNMKGIPELIFIMI